MLLSQTLSAAGTLETRENDQLCMLGKCLVHALDELELSGQKITAVDFFCDFTLL